MPGIREVAEEVRRWALSNRMMGNFPVSPPVDLATIRNIFGTVGVPAAVKTLQHRGVSYIGINEKLSEIIIFTKKNLSATERRSFERIILKSRGEDITFSFVQSSIAHVGRDLDPPVGVPTFEMLNGRFTCGSSIYIASEKGAGTLGCLVRDKAGTLYGLSNNHITGGSNYAEPGLPIVAPGMADVAAGAQDPETIGHHRRAYPFVDGLPEVVDAAGNLDAAIFEIKDPNRVCSMQRKRYDTPTDCLPLEVGMVVEKVGRTSSLTKGEVIAELFGFWPVQYDVDVIGGKKIIYFSSMFAIEGKVNLFSYSGDSGSLIVYKDSDEKRFAVGIVVAGNTEGITFALPFDRILTHFDVELVSGHNT